MSADRVSLVLEGFAGEPLRLAVAGTLRVYAQSAQGQNRGTAASILRQAAVITGQGGGVLELEFVTRGNLGEVIDTMTHSVDARKVELAAVLAECRVPLEEWGSALFRLWGRLVAAAAAMPAGSIPPLGDTP